MTKTLRSAPPAVRMAASIFLAELLGIVIAGGLAVNRHQFISASTAVIALAVTMGFLVLGCMAVLAVGVVYGANPRKRFRETYVFQGIIFLACALSLPSRFSFWTVSYALAAVAVVALLALPTSRHYASDQPRQPRDRS